MENLRGVLCYFSGSGNTKLACEYIARSLSHIEMDLYDITSEEGIDLEEYTMIGFATFTDSFDVPQKMKDFIKSLGRQKKYAILLNTYGCMSGKTLPVMKKLAVRQGFTLLGGYSLHCPENYPPMITAGNAASDAPNEEELSEFRDFIDAIDEEGLKLRNGMEIEPVAINISTMDLMLPKWLGKLSSRMNGNQFSTDRAKCIKCGKCEKVCPYNAIDLSREPIIDAKKCEACWRCYNFCPSGAIYTKKLKGQGQYSQPNEQLIKKLRK